MTKERSNNALQIIFSFFLGLMVLALIGVGVNTFYPSPQSKVDTEIQALYRQQEQLNRKSGNLPMSVEDQRKSDEIQKKIDAINTANEAEIKDWARNTSIVLIIFATLVMSISLVRSEQLRVISNGLLLGGLFTVVYGVGWVIFSGESTARFVVIVFAFAITVGLGYLKFVRSREGVAAPLAVTSEAGVGDSGAVRALSARVEALESRLSAAAELLGAGEKSESR